MDKLISIIIPIYNSKRFLERCIESILNVENIEIILIDDGSTDGSWDVCKKYMERYNEIITGIHIQNNGVSNARNIGIERAKGKYIFFLDSDDYVDTEVFSKCINKIKNKTYDMYIYGFKRRGDKGVIYEKNIEELLRPEEACCKLIYWKIKICIGSFFIKSEIAKRNEFILNSKYGEDMEFIYKCMLMSKNIKVEKDIFMNYIMHKDSTMGKITIRRFDTYFARKRILGLVVEQYNEYKKLMKELENYSIPEAIAQNINNLSYEGVGYYEIKNFFKDNNIILKEYEEKEIDKQFKEIIHLWNKNSILFYITKRKEYYIYQIKSKVYNLIKGV